jgi:predicted DNA-binding WGR domain protein
MALDSYIMPSQQDVFPDCLRLRRVDGARNMNRYYFMAVQRDLFGGASLIREWGRSGRAGRVQVSHHADEGQAVDALSEFVSRKRKRGYEISQ